MWNVGAVCPETVDTRGFFYSGCQSWVKKDKALEAEMKALGLDTSHLEEDGIYEVEAEDVLSALHSATVAVADLKASRIITPAGIEYDLAFLDRLVRINRPFRPLVWRDTNVPPKVFYRKRFPLIDPEETEAERRV